MANMKTEFITITRRSKNLGIGSTSDVEQVRNGMYSYLRNKDVTAPDVSGSLKAVEAEFARINRIYGPHVNKNVCLFVGGKPVMDREIGLILSIVRNLGSYQVEVPV